MSPLLLLLACSPSQDLFRHFDGPIAASIVDEGIGPFDVATGYVANSRGGTVVPLDLVAGRLLADDPAASFLRGSVVAFGDERILSDVVAYATPTTVDIWTLDDASGFVLRAPYVIGVDDAGPREVDPTDDGVVFFDGDASGDTPVLADLQLRSGLTTTEDWSIEYDGERWWAKGSASGQQDREPLDGEPYWSDNREVEFTLNGTATLGDRFEFHTETGVRAFDFGARARALLLDGDLLYVSLVDGEIVVLDAGTAARLDTVVLAEGSQPGRFAIDDVGTVFVADTALPQVHVLSGGLGAYIDTPIPTLGPVVDVAWSGGAAQDGTAFQHLFVVPVGLGRVDVYDTVAGAWVDPNPVTAAIEGIPLDLPITGLAASRGPTRLQIPTEYGAWPAVPTVLVATGAGVVYELDGSTGCFVATGEGPKGPNSITDDLGSALLFTDVGIPSSAGILVDGETGTAVAASSCPGVTFSESWVVTYDGALLSWEVVGSRSGAQQKRAYDDVRYVSDTGAISFFLASGALPPSTGDNYVFATESNLLIYSNSDPGSDGVEQFAWSYPGRPATYALEGGPTGGGWDEYDVDQYALLPVTNSDITATLLLDEGASTSYYH